MFPMDVLNSLGQEQIEWAADYLGLRISKNLLGTLIKQYDSLIGINGYNRVLGDFQNPF